ncbi:hypothetical protein CLAFUW4_02307 [Fulvia fulva]|uniref:F-box domain-containing protein n=1 Tax=Passalora fulva TaxID=5499 RepID=A0A9Q8L604_PASFU|nr:uncharacterized protein CLAFUR5_02296 [Fulvia fulva]KAK4634226.1 hypothetical protein CLAFUR4_02302 [Fulvia fulva]KAK4637026.1 hypothetical protein CLAFUR0_02306 [Fulvia fulva]UJO11463.1 hypothetical protein CLAFUR5_02296 [Fulvia fulva]WPV10187.1 hypothetical protein CLAFUW4_02307 [Fulvia fulva]WPV23537.1 hypothetical protein CLAFUW7_02307 [Fulvia fulva]
MQLQDRMVRADALKHITLSSSHSPATTQSTTRIIYNYHHDRNSPHARTTGSRVRNMSAAQQVFDTAELLEIIICQCPPYQIQELKSVARSWRDMINSSNAVRRSRVLLTLCSDAPDYDNDDVPLWDVNTFCTYYATDWVRLNPVFEKVHYEFGQMRIETTYYDITIVLPSSLSHSSSLEEFVTTPPVAAITLGTRCWSSDNGEWHVPDNENACTAYNKEGLKVKDILAVRDALIAAQHTSSDNQPPSVDTIVQAGFEIEGTNAQDNTLEDRMLHDLYFQGFLPRYRKASDMPGTRFEKAKQRDRALDWHPSMDSRKERLYYDNED